jgi:hypothetical protein
MVRLTDRMKQTDAEVCMVNQMVLSGPIFCNFLTQLSLNHTQGLSVPDIVRAMCTDRPIQFFVS